MEKESKKKIFLVYIILCLLFIWGQSLLPGAQSSGESSFVLEKLVHPFEETLFGQASSTEAQVRKAAHVFEYTMLGMGLAGYFFLDCGCRKQALFRSVSAGVLAALLDETVQLFSGRGSQVKDVWIDSIGILQGSLLVVLLISLLAGRNKKTGKNLPGAASGHVSTLRSGRR